MRAAARRRRRRTGAPPCGTMSLWQNAISGTSSARAADSAAHASGPASPTSMRSGLACADLARPALQRERPAMPVRAQRPRTKIAFAARTLGIGVAGDEQRVANGRMAAQPRALRPQVANDAAAGRRVQHGYIEQMHPSNRGGGDPRIAHGSTGKSSGILPVQRRPPARRPGRFTTCSRALLSCPRGNLSTGIPGVTCPCPSSCRSTACSNSYPEPPTACSSSHSNSMVMTVGVLGVDFDDVDGDGVTTGGVVDDGFDSRWQPATPSARPVQSSMTKALLIVISRSGLKEGCNDGISRFDAMKQLERGVRARGIFA